MLVGLFPLMCATVLLLKLLPLWVFALFGKVLNLDFLKRMKERCPFLGLESLKSSCKCWFWAFLVVLINLTFFVFYSPTHHPLERIESIYHNSVPTSTFSFLLLNPQWGQKQTLHEIIDIFYLTNVSTKWRKINSLTI